MAVETIMEGNLTRRFSKFGFKKILGTVMIILTGFFNLVRNWELEISEKSIWPKFQTMKKLRFQIILHVIFMSFFIMRIGK